MEVSESFILRKKEAALADWVAKKEALKEVCFGMIDHSDWRTLIDGGREATFAAVLSIARETVLKQKGIKRLLEAAGRGRQPPPLINY